MPIINFSKYSPLLNSGYFIIYFPNTYIFDAENTASQIICNQDIKLYKIYDN